MNENEMYSNREEEGSEWTGNGKQKEKIMYLQGEAQGRK